MSMYCVSATYRPRDNWQMQVQAPEAPSNYKDPVKIAAYVEAAWSRKSKAAAQEPVTGCFESVLVCVKRGDVWESVENKTGSAVLELLERPEVIYGLEIRSFMRMAVAELAVKRILSAAQRWAVLDEFGRSLDVSSKVQFVDPVKALTGQHVDQLSLPAFAAQFRLTTPVGGFLFSEPLSAVGAMHLTLSAAKLLGA